MHTYEAMGSKTDDTDLIAMRLIKYSGARLHQDHRLIDFE